MYYMLADFELKSRTVVGVRSESNMSRDPNFFVMLARRALVYGSCTLGPSAMHIDTNPETRTRGARTLQKNCSKNKQKYSKFPAWRRRRRAGLIIKSIVHLHDQKPPPDSWVVWCSYGCCLSMCTTARRGALVCASNAPPNIWKILKMTS